MFLDLSKQTSIEVTWKMKELHLTGGWNERSENKWRQVKKSKALSWQQ